VIESSVSNNQNDVTSSNINFTVLDEGSVLFLKLDDEVNIDSNGDHVTIGDNNQNHCRVVPLGKVLEIFGPVSKPFYVVRLKLLAKNKVKASSIDSGGRKSDITQKQEVDVKDFGARQEDENNSTREENVKGSNGVHGNNSKEPSNTSKTAAVVEKISQEKDKKVSDTTDNEKNNLSEKEDPWSRTGIYTKWIQSKPRIEVYFSCNQAKIVNSLKVARNSGKGCDASNLYDEEINVNEMDFSDDEEERRVKQTNRGIKRYSKGRKNNTKGRDGTFNRSSTNVSKVQQGRRLVNRSYHHNNLTPIRQQQTQWGASQASQQQYNSGYLQHTQSYSPLHTLQTSPLHPIPASAPNYTSTLSQHYPNLLQRSPQHSIPPSAVNYNSLLSQNQPNALQTYPIYPVPHSAAHYPPMYSQHQQISSNVSNMGHQQLSIVSSPHIPTNPPVSQTQLPGNHQSRPSLHQPEQQHDVEESDTIYYNYAK